MHDSDDLRRTALRIVDYEMWETGENQEAEGRPQKMRSNHSNPGMFANSFGGSLNRIDQGVGSSWIVFRNSVGCLK
jgi:hypothetical protein